jgi:hypothetical protein
VKFDTYKVSFDTYKVSFDTNTHIHEIGAWRGPSRKTLLVAPSLHAPHRHKTLISFPTFGVLNPWSYKLLASSVVILTLLNPGAPSSPSRGRWTRSPNFVLTEQDLHQSRTLLVQGHVIHAHPTHGTKSYVLRYPRTLLLSNSRLFSPGSVPSPGYTSVGTNVTFQFPPDIPGGEYSLTPGTIPH